MNPSSEVSLIHQWLRKKYGKANKCENKKCLGKSHNFDWSLIYGKKHAKRRTNYRMLCRSCHFKYDYKNGNFEAQRNCLSLIGRRTGKPNGKTMCKFKLKDIERIRNSNDSGITQRAIAKFYNVHPSTISLICNRKTYLDEQQKSSK